MRDRRLNAPCLSEAEQAAFTFTSEMLYFNRCTDATFDRLCAQFNERQIVELLIVTGTYTMVCHITTALRGHELRSGPCVVRSHRYWLVCMFPPFYSLFNGTLP